MTTGPYKTMPSQGDGNLPVDVPIYTKIGPVKDIPWLWPGRIPRGQVTLIEGAQGAGKSFVTLDLAARFSRGVPWPAPRQMGQVEGGVRTFGAGVSPAPGRRDACTTIGPTSDSTPMGNVLLVTQQDDSGTIDRRLEGLGADIDRICRFETVVPEEHADNFPKLISNQRPLEFPRDVAIIRNQLYDTEEIALVVIDPLTDFCDGPARVAQTLRELSKLARQMDVAIVVTLPANCRFDVRGALRVTSRYKTDAARCVWCVVADRDNPARRLFVARRTNSYVEPPGLAFRLHEGHVIWNAEGPIDALDPLGQESAIRDYLTSAMESGSLPAADVIRLGALAGFAAAQLRVVAKLMGIEFRKMQGFGKEGGWEWVLPGATRESGGEKGERRNEGMSSDDMASSVAPQQSGGKPSEGGTPTTQAQESREAEMLVLSDGTLIEATVLISAKEIWERKVAEEAKGGNEKGEERGEKSESFPQSSGLTPQAQLECATADAKNSKSMENRGKNGDGSNHESNGRLPRDKYARAQERKRRAKQRRETVMRGR